MSTAAPKFRIKKSTETLPVRLTPAELLEKGKLGRDMSELARTIKAGEEDRTVPVEEHYDFDNKTLTVRRVDTGALVSERPLDYEELQVEFDFHQNEERKAKMEAAAEAKKKQGKLSAVDGGKD